MTGSLAGKRVLFVAPRFFGYDDDVAAELLRRGARVVRLYDRPFDAPLMTAVTKIAPRIVSSAAVLGYRERLALESEPFDVVFVINGQTMPSIFLETLRQHSPGAQFILYLWDGLRNRTSIVRRLGKFDRVLGFDRSDARIYGYDYRPLFFGPAFDKPLEADSAYDISFVGTAHSDRAPIVHAIDAQLPAHIRRRWFLFLQAPWVRRYYALRSARFRAIPAGMFTYTALPKAETSAIFKKSRAILDIEHPLQNGLTMRTFEALAMNKKIITTNRNILEEDFYNPESIHVICRNNPKIPNSFIENENVNLSDDLRKKYSISGWIDDIVFR